MEKEKSVMRSSSSALPIEFETLPLNGVSSILGPMLLVLVALVMQRTWEELFFIGSTAYFPNLGFNNYQIFLAAKAVGLFGCVVFARPIDEGFRKPTAFVVCGVLMALSTILMLATLLPVLFDSAPLVVAGGIVGGLGAALFTVLWFQVCRFIVSPQALLLFLGAGIVSLIVIVMGDYFGFAWVIVVGLLCSVTCPLVLRRGLHLLFNAQDRIRVEAYIYRATDTAFWKVSFLLAVFTFAFALGKPVLGNSLFAAGSHTALGSLLVSIYVCVGILLNSKHFDIAILFRIVLPITAVFSLLLLTGLSIATPLADNCLSASFKIAEVLAVSTVANLCYRRQLSPAFLIGIAFGLKTLFCFLGGALWGFVGFLGSIVPSQQLMMLVFAAAVAGAVLLAMVTFQSRDSLVITSEELASKASSQEPDAYEDLAYRCHDLAKRAELTPREEEVLLLFAEGKNSTDVAKELFISKETVKTHRRGLYRKCGVTTRGELLELLDENK